MSREFEIISDVELPSTPNDVWTAITADSAAWMFPTGPTPTGDEDHIKTWDPPHHLLIRVEAPDGNYNSLEYLIKARDGGTAHLRYVHSGIFADGWEDQYDGAVSHTAFYLHTLGQYLEHFNGRDVTYIGQPSSGIEGPESAGEADSMDVLRTALGVPSSAGVGYKVQTSLGEAGELNGVIDYSTPEFLGVRTKDGLYRFFGRNHYGSVVGMSAHLFADDIDAAEQQAALKAWLDAIYA